jgi:hypothetical protein
MTTTRPPPQLRPRRTSGGPPGQLVSDFMMPLGAMEGCPSCMLEELRRRSTWANSRYTLACAHQPNAIRRGNFGVNQCQNFGEWLACLDPGCEHNGAQAARCAADPGADPRLARGQGSPLDVRGKTWYHVHAARITTAHAQTTDTEQPGRRGHGAGIYADTQQPGHKQVTTSHKKSRHV